MNKGWIIAIVVFLIIGLIGACNGGDSSSDDYPYGYEKCFRCNGSGLVNQGFIDFETCPVCRGSGMLDSH